MEMKLKTKRKITVGAFFIGVGSLIVLWRLPELIHALAPNGLVH